MVVAIETLQTTGGLRMVEVPQNIAQDFLNSASSNTRRNIETGGFLAGKLVSGHIVVMSAMILLITMWLHPTYTDKFNSSLQTFQHAPMT